MAVIAGDLVTRLGIDGRKFQSGLSKARGETRSFAADVTSIVSGIAIADIGKRAVGGIVDMATSVVKLAADAQTAQITFEVLVGDAAKGAKLFKEIEKFAARTSFDLTSAADATKSLLAAGVGESDVLNTMQLLGDLAMGDANKLGFLSKAYTDVMNKGKLQGQEIRQFAENGVGLVGALASSMNKTNAEILKMSEAGQISFADMKKALESLTGPGGRFFGMMARINETFTGQWNSLVENIQTFGRDLGALVLPKLTAIVAETNKLLTAFNSLGDARWKFAADLIVASFDVAMETIRLHWSDMLNDMLDQVMKIDWMQLLNPFGGININDLRPDAKPANLQQAQLRLADLMKKLQPPKQQPFQWQGPREQGFAASILRNMKPKPGEIGGALGKMFDAIGNDALVASTRQGLSGILDRAKIKGGAIGGMLTGWLGTESEKPDAVKKQEPKLAGAMAAGSQEAFSTIFAAMLQRGKDPNVTATEKQTKELKTALKELNLPQWMAMGSLGL